MEYLALMPLQEFKGGKIGGVLWLSDRLSMMIQQVRLKSAATMKVLRKSHGVRTRNGECPPVKEFMMEHA